jgi:hypothetical protein
MKIQRPTRIPSSLVKNSKGEIGGGGNSRLHRGLEVSLERLVEMVYFAEGHRMDPFKAGTKYLLLLDRDSTRGLCLLLHLGKLLFGGLGRLDGVTKLRQHPDVLFHRIHERQLIAASAQDTDRGAEVRQEWERDRGDEFSSGTDRGAITYFAGWSLTRLAHASIFAAAPVSAIDSLIASPSFVLALVQTLESAS